MDVEVAQSIHLLGSQFAGLGGNQEDTVAVMLNCAGFMNLDMAGIGSDNTLPGTQECAKGGFIGLGATHDKVDIRTVTMAQATDQFLGTMAVRVNTITGGQFQIGLAKGLHDLRMSAIAIIVSKMKHKKIPLLLCYGTILAQGCPWVKFFP